jgi:hypothetical protein
LVWDVLRLRRALAVLVMSTSAVRVRVTADVEPMQQHMYRLRIDAIKWQMRLDQKRLFDAFAARWGVVR